MILVTIGRLMVVMANVYSEISSDDAGMVKGVVIMLV